MENKEWNWIKDCLDEKESKDFKKYMDGFSDFLTVFNKDYLYNKKFLSAYADEFIKYNKIFSEKYNVLYNIMFLLKESKTGIKDVVVYLDGLVRTYDEKEKSVDININREDFYFYDIKNEKSVVEILYESGKNIYQFEIDNNKTSIKREIEKFIEKGASK